MTLHTTIMTYGKGLDVFRMNRHLWQEQQPSGGLVICPTDDRTPEPESPWPIVHIGKSDHMGTGALERQRWLLEYLPSFDATHFLIHEYDSFTFGQLNTDRKGFFANVWINLDQNRFMAPRYANHPWLIDRESLLLMAAAAKRWPDMTEEGAADRYYGALAMLAGVPLMQHQPRGYSLATITEPFIPAMVAAIKAGATMIHGVKHSEVLRAAEAARYE